MDMVMFFIQLLVPFALIFFRMPKARLFRYAAPVVFIFLAVSFYFMEDSLLALPGPWSYYLFYLLPYLAVVAASLTMFNMTVFNALYYCVFSFVVQNFAHHLCRLFINGVIMFTAVDLDAERISSFIVYSVFYLVVYSAFYVLYLRDRRFEANVSISSLSVLALAASFILVLIILGVYIRHMQAELLRNMGIAIVYEIYSVILDVFLICLLIGLFRTNKLRDDANELERRLAQEGHYYEMAQANMELINIKCHDLKHQIAALRSMDDSAERSAEIEELQNAVMFYDNYAKTGNEALDCVLTEKGLFCNQKGIRFTYMADGAGLSHMRYMDIYALFGNALDNAIENVTKIADENKRIISLRVFVRAGFVNIHVENYCEDMPTVRNGLPVTTKTDTNRHGYGLRSIRYIAQKYGGNFNFNVTDNTFCLSVLIPLESKA